MKIHLVVIRTDVFCNVQLTDSTLLCAKWSSGFWSVAGVALGYACLKGDMHYSLPVPLGMTLSCHNSMQRVLKNRMCAVSVI